MLVRNAHTIAFQSALSGEGGGLRGPPLEGPDFWKAYSIAYKLA
jgi:hypothetical protein